MRPFFLRTLYSCPRTFVASKPRSPLARTKLAPLLATTVRNMSSDVPSPVLKAPLKMALIQLASGKDKDANLKHAAEKVKEAAGTGAKLVVLPECFNSPYGIPHCSQSAPFYEVAANIVRGTNFFPEYAEVLLPKPSTAPSFDALSKMAKDNSVYLVGGSIPEYNPSTKKHHNTTLIFSPSGSLLATHRKVHLFDIDIPGKITFRESDVLTAGNQVTIVDLPEYGKIGVSICYDVRFPELATIATRKGAFALIYPGAFNLTTGPLHWKLLAQARAVDNQIYVAMCSPARDMSASYHAYGHSLVIDPMAQTVGEAQENEEIVTVDLSSDKLEETRRNIPLNTQRRYDVYPDVSKGRIQFEDPDLKQPQD